MSVLSNKDEHKLKLLIDNVYNNISITPVCSLKTCFIKSTKSKYNPKTLEDLEKENIISYL